LQREVRHLARRCDHDHMIRAKKQADDVRVGVGVGARDRGRDLA
jgi:hypothetical protein